MLARLESEASNQVMARKKEDGTFVPQTKYQKWLEPLLIERGVKVAELGRMIGKDYNYIWKLARGEPGVNRNQERPGYEVAFAIGEALGDTIGSLTAADYPVPNLSVIRAGISAQVFHPSGASKQLTVTEDDILRLLLEAEMRENRAKNN